MLPIVKHSVATAEKSISLISQSLVGLNGKYVTAYFIWLNIILFSRKSIITEFCKNAAFEAQKFRQMSERRLTN